MAETEREVLVAGAGPVGLTAALALRTLGREVTVLEAASEDRMREGSRAIYVHGETLRLLEGVLPGLGRRLAEHGLMWRARRTCWKGREVFARSYPPPDGDRLPHFTSLPQAVTERLLLQACCDAGVELRWSQPVTSVVVDAAAVHASADGDIWRSRYLVGADGARSAVRRALGVPMEGSRSSNRYVVVDVAEVTDDGLPIERVFHYMHPAVGGRHVLLVPFAGGWRIDLQCHPGDRPEEYSTDAGLRRWLPRIMPAAYADAITWVSTYQFLQVVARTFTDAHRRVLLAGEAAHLFAPFGARGMNSGMADAIAAARAIDTALDAIEPGADAHAVGAFAEDRRQAALYNRSAAGQALRHMQALNPATRLRRRIAAALAPRSQRAGSWLDSAPYGPRGGRDGKHSTY